MHSAVLVLPWRCLGEAVRPGGCLPRASQWPWPVAESCLEWLTVHRLTGASELAWSGTGCRVSRRGWGSRPGLGGFQQGPGQCLRAPHGAAGLCGPCSLSSPAGVPRTSSMLPFSCRILGAAGSRALCRMLELLGGQRWPWSQEFAVTLKAGRRCGQCPAWPAGGA